MLLHLFDLLGCFVFGLTGALLATQKRMDLFGMFILALVTAIGGGTLRDLMVGNTPLFFLLDPDYICVIFASTLCTFLFHQTLLKVKSVILILDAVGLGTFVCIGVSKGLEHGIPAFGAVLMGLITAVVGGILRDVLAGDIPVILSRDFYAMACVIGGIAYIILYDWKIPEEIVIAAASAITILLRLLAIKFKWNFIRVDSHYDC